MINKDHLEQVKQCHLISMCFVILLPLFKAAHRCDIFSPVTYNFSTLKACNVMLKVKATVLNRSRVVIVYLGQKMNLNLIDV